MKVKNKKTGEIAEAEFDVCSVGVLLTFEDGRICNYYVDSIKDFMTEWEIEVDE